MADKVRVLVGAKAASFARQFVTSVERLGSHLTQLAAAADRLAEQSAWQGSSAERFREEHQSFATHARAMTSALAHMGHGAQSVIEGIDREDASAASGILVFPARGTAAPGGPRCRRRCPRR